MQTTLNHTSFSHLPHQLETIAARLTAQLLEISANPTDCDPDLFGKLQRNLNGILRSLSTIEKRLGKTPANTPPMNQMDRMDTTEPVALKPHSSSPSPSSSPRSPICEESVARPKTPPQAHPKQTPCSSVVKQPATPNRRPSKAERRLLKIAKRRQLSPKLVQTSEQNPNLPFL